MLRLKLLGCYGPSFDCIKRVVEELPGSEILDYFAELASIKFVPFHPALEVVSSEVQLIKDGDEVIGAVIKIVASDGEKNYLFSTSCIRGESGELICYPSPQEHRA